MQNNIKYQVLYLVLPEFEHEYPKIYQQHSLKYPKLLEYIEDESITMILDKEKDLVYTADDFFKEVWIMEFEAKVMAENDPLTIYPEK